MMDNNSLVPTASGDPLVTEEQASAAAVDAGIPDQVVKRAKGRRVIGRYLGQNGPLEQVLADADADLALIDHMIEQSRGVADDPGVDPLLRSEYTKHIALFLGDKRKIHEAKIKLVELAATMAQMMEPEKPKNKPPVIGRKA